MQVDDENMSWKYQEILKQLILTGRKHKVYSKNYPIIHNF
jgi:hypothetical protein